MSRRVTLMEAACAARDVMAAQPLFNPMGWTARCPAGAEDVQYAYLEERHYLFQLVGHPDVRVLVTARSPSEAWEKWRSAENSRIPSNKNGLKKTSK